VLADLRKDQVCRDRRGLVEAYRLYFLVGNGRRSKLEQLVKLPNPERTGGSKLRRLDPLAMQCVRKLA
jgi:hypothetical protein